MDKFEYKILNISREHLKRESFQEELMEKLNALGDDCLELISIEGLTEGCRFWKVWGTVDVLFIFKRKKTK